MLDPFKGVSAGHAVEYLRSALESGNVTHAYLLVGSAGCGHDELALHFASALVAEDNDEQFQIALRGAHPDIHQLHPASQAGYLVEQVRDAVHDATLAPVRSSRKVYIVHDADHMNGAPANAFLKTLEEPPASVHIILLAATEGGVLQTLRSRCQVLNVAAGDGEAVDPRIAACMPQVASMMAALSSGAGNRAVLAYAKEVVAAGSSEVEDLKDAHARQQAEAADYLTTGARKDLEQAHKRQEAMEQRAGLAAQLGAVEAWLRDCLVLCSKAPLGSAAKEGALDDPAKQAVAGNAGNAAVISALSAVDAARDRISHNVTPQLAMEAMLLEIREALCQR